jgi:hypothetical protein
MINTIKCNKYKLETYFQKGIGLCHPLDGIANPKHKLLHFLATNFISQREEGASFSPG